MQVLSALLDYLASTPRLDSFLSKQPPAQFERYDYSTGRSNTISYSVIDVSPNADASPGTMLYERFLDVTVRHAAGHGGK
jgi:hypothetical protein